MMTDALDDQMRPWDGLSGLRTVTRLVASEAEGPTRSMLRGFRERLAGELLGDVERALAVVHDDFILTTAQAGAATSTLTKADLARSIERMASLGGAMLMWLEFDHLVAAGEQLAASGKMYHTFSAAHAATHLGQEELGSGTYTATSEVGIFCRFRDDKMIEEFVLVIPDPAGLAYSPDFEIPNQAELARATAGLC